MIANLDSPEKSWQSSDFDLSEANKKNSTYGNSFNKQTSFLSSSNNKSDKNQSSYSNLTNFTEMNDIDSSPFRGSKKAKNSRDLLNTSTFEIDSPITKKKKTPSIVFDVEDVENSPNLGKKKNTNITSTSSTNTTRIFDLDDDDSDGDSRLTFDMMVSKPPKKTAKPKAATTTTTTKAPKKNASSETTQNKPPKVSKTTQKNTTDSYLDASTIRTTKVKKRIKQ